MRGASDSIFRSTLTKLTGNCGDFPGIDRDPLFEHRLLHRLVLGAAQRQHALHEPQPVDLEARLHGGRIEEPRGPIAGRAHAAHGQVRLEALVRGLEKVRSWLA